MKKIKKILCLLFSLLILFSLICGCNEVKKNEVPVTIKFPDIIQGTDSNLVSLEKFKSQSKTQDGNLYGVIKCPFYNVIYNGNNEVYSYSVPSVSSELHSFGYLEVTQDMLPINITIKPKENIGYNLDSAIVIPEKFGIKAKTEDNAVTFTIDKIDNYTVLFNGKFNFSRPYTLYVKEYKPMNVPKGYDVIEFQPGLHFVDRIKDLKDNTYIYLHTGAYLIAKQPDIYTEKNSIDSMGQAVWRAFIYGNGVKNIKIEGNGIIDFSSLSWHARVPVGLTSCSNVEINDITLIDSTSWTVSLTDCKDIKITNLILMAYRTNSDGIMLSNCKNAVVSNCFARSGDDLLEVKATKSVAPNTNTGGENIVFRHNQTWAEKSRCFGFIQEAEMNVNNVLFEDNSVLYQDAIWDSAMGAYLVILGDGATISDITFRGCDGYFIRGYLINISVGKNQWSISGNIGSVHDITFENMRFYSYYSDDESLKNYGIRLQNTKENGTENDLSDIHFNNITIDNKKLNSITEIKSDIIGLYKNITLNGNAI